MSWFSIDAVDGALQRTKKTLFEPFSFWKWLKLGIIILLLGGSGGGGGSNYSNPAQQYGGKDPGWAPDLQSFEEMVSQFLDQYSMFIILGVIFFLGLILLFSYISNVMEFVLVNSLVTGVVAFWEYSRKYMRQGFNLFIIRLVLGLIFLILFIGAMLPVILPILNSLDNIENLDLDFGMFLGGIFFFLGVFFVLAIISGIIESFINLSIPLAMYQDMGIIAAFKIVFARFKADLWQIIVYWFMRLVLGIVVGIIVVIIALILLIVVFGIFAIFGFGLYLLLSSGAGLGIEDAMFWVVMAPFGIVAFILLFILSLLVSVPAPVFMKYHMLTFLESWYPESGIPFNDRDTLNNP